MYIFKILSLVVPSINLDIKIFFWYCQLSNLGQLGLQACCAMSLPTSTFSILAGQLNVDPEGIVSIVGFSQQQLSLPLL